MTINSFNANASTVVTGLGTQTCNVTTAGLYTCAMLFSIPYQASGGLGDSTTTSGGSSLQVVVKNNGGSALLTLSSPSPYQATMGGSVRIQCAANDVITVALTSAAAVDNATNAIKGIINFFQGE